MAASSALNQSNIQKGSSLGRTIRNAWAITKRDLLHWKQQPEVVLIVWAFPVMVTLLFGLFFGGAIAMPGVSSYNEFLVPGMLAMTVVFGLESTVLAVATDASKGVTDRFRSMPINSAAVVLGRCLADVLSSIVGLAIMVIAGLLLGWSWHEGLSGFLLAIGLLFLLRFALLWMGIFMGLVVKGPEAVAGVQILVWPIGFLSSVFVNPSTMPAWLGTIAEWNPISATVTATRDLFGNPGWQGTSWASEHAILLAIVWPLIITAIFLPLAIHRYRNLNN